MTARSSPLIVRLLGLLLLPLVSGCSTLGTFQTPDLAEPGQFILGVGAGLSHPGDQEIDDVPHPPPLEAYLRFGIHPRVELGARLGLFTAGLDAKVGLIKEPFLLSLAGGLGIAGSFDIGTTYEHHTAHGALLAGRGALYGGIKLTRLHEILYTTTCDTCEQSRIVERTTDLIPALTVGYVSRKPRRFNPILEVTNYFLPEGEAIWALNVGLQMRF